MMMIAVVQVLAAVKKVKRGKADKKDREVEAVRMAKVAGKVRRAQKDTTGLQELTALVVRRVQVDPSARAERVERQGKAVAQELLDRTAQAGQ